jgi:hypothetical protein
MSKPKSLLLALVALSIAGFAGGCGHKRVEYEGSDGVASTGESGKSLKARVIWLKNKKDTVDLSVQLANQYDKPIAFKRSAIKLSFNGVEGVFKKSGFSGDMAPGSMEQELIIFSFEPAAPKTGTVVLTIDPITTEDGGKKLAALKLELPVAK